MLISMPEERSLPVPTRNVANARGALPSRMAWCPRPPSMIAATSVSNRIHPARLGLSLAVTLGVLYLLCALLSAVAPAAWATALGVVAHGLNMVASAQQLAPAGPLHVLAGALVIMGCSAFAGLLFAWIQNFSHRDKGLAAPRRSGF